MGSKHIYCQICARQIVNYNASNDKYVGSDTETCLRLVGGCACHECKASEIEFGELMEGDVN